MSELRQRQVPPRSSSPSSNTRKSKSPQRNSHARSSISILDILRVLVTLVVASCGLSYYMTGDSVIWGYRPWFTRWPLLLRYIQGPLALTPAQLSLYNGSDASLPIYLSINGTIFDVSANPHVYGPGGGYNFFAGRDATRAFVTGCFQEDQTHDLTGVEEMYIPLDSESDSGLSSGERKIRRAQDVKEARVKVHAQVAHWQNFFRNHKKYFEVGRVVGLEELPREKKELCRAAAQQRPKTRKEK